METFKDNIIQKIKSGEVSMKPKWYFVLRAFLLFFGVLLTALVSVYLLSFIVFTLHKTGIWFAPTFGMKGIMILLVSSPWILILVLTCFLGFLYLLVKQYSFSYRKPLVYSMVGSVVFVVLVSTVVVQAAIHDKVDAFVQTHQVPGFTPLYNAVGKERPAGVAVGTITEITDNGFILQADAELITIKIAIFTRQPTGREYKVGDKVMVLGKKTDNFIKAFGVRHLEEALSN